MHLSAHCRCDMTIKFVLVGLVSGNVRSLGGRQEGTCVRSLDVRAVEGSPVSVTAPLRYVYVSHFCVRGPSHKGINHFESRKPSCR